MASFERYLYEDLARLQMFNTRFLALRTQLEAMLSSVGGRMPAGGVPNWWERRWTGEAIEILQHRIVGECYLPAMAGVVVMSFPVIKVDTEVGEMTFEMHEMIEKIRFRVRTFRNAFYPRAKGYTVGVPALADERDFWRQRVESSPFPAIAGVVATAVESVAFKKAVVVAMMPPSEFDSLDGVGLSPTYRSLLAYSNGLCVNGFRVMGDLDSGRVIQLGKERFLLIAKDTYTRYAAPIQNGAAVDEVYRFSVSGRKWKTTGKNVLELCETALEHEPVRRRRRWKYPK